MKGKSLILAVLLLLSVSVIGLAACHKDTPATKFTVTFETNGGASANAITVDDGKSITLPTVTKEGYVFDGWYDNDALSGERLTSPYTPIGNVTLYAKWNKETYTVAFDANGGSAAESAATESGGSIELPETTKDGYIFDGWYDNEELSGNRLSSPYTPDGNITLYAKWLKMNLILSDNGGSYTVTGVTDSTATELTVPESYGGKPIAEIANGALADCTAIERLTVPFVGQKVDGTGETHFGYIFGADTYESHAATVPESLKTVVVTGKTPLGSCAFCYCDNLTSVTIVRSTYIDEFAFYQCGALESVSIGSGATYIGNYALYECVSLKSLTLPDSVNEVGKYVLYGCSSLESLTVPFVGAKKDGTENTHFGYIFGAADHANNGVPKSLRSLVITGGTTIADHAFDSCEKLTSITLPNTVVAIGKNAFNTCISLKEFVIPNGVTVIEKGAFANCRGMESISIPQSVTAIGRSAFIACVALVEVAIPNGVREIGDLAFQNCSALTSVSIPNTVTSIGGYAFRNCVKLTSVVIPDSVNEIGSNVFSGCNALESITIPFVGEKKDGSGSVRFGWYFGVFDNTTDVPASLKTVTVTGGNSIGERAFYQFASLVSVILPDGIASIGHSAFYRCTALENFSIPESVRTIEPYAFEGCVALKSVVIPEGATIGEWAFNGCGFTSVTVPNSVTQIGEGAFAYCKMLTKFNIPTGLTAIPDWLLRGCFSLKSVTIPYGVVSIGSVSFGDCGLTNIIIPDSVTTIGEFVFQNCASLTSIEIPKNVTSIGKYAFLNCSTLTSITYRGTKAEWNAITKGSYWNKNTGNYTVTCSDETISK